MNVWPCPLCATVGLSCAHNPFRHADGMVPTRWYARDRTPSIQGCGSRWRLSRPATSPQQNAGRSAACLHEAYSEHTRRAGSARVPDAVQRDPRPALSALTRVFDALWRGEGGASAASAGWGARSRAAKLVLMPALAPHPARAFGARHPRPAPRGEGEATHHHFALRLGYAIGCRALGRFSAYKTHFLLDYNSKRC